jgi:hypothetical protein
VQRRVEARAEAQARAEAWGSAENVDTDCWGNGAATRSGGATGSSSNAIATEFSELSLVIAEYNPEPRRVSEIMRGLPNGRGLGSFFWEPTQGGDWGRAMFTCENGVCRANAADFQVFDRIRQDFRL